MRKSFNMTALFHDLCFSAFMLIHSCVSFSGLCEQMSLNVYLFEFGWPSCLYLYRRCLSVYVITYRELTFCFHKINLFMLKQLMVVGNDGNWLKAARAGYGNPSRSKENDLKKNELTLLERLCPCTTMFKKKKKYLNQFHPRD